MRRLFPRGNYAICSRRAIQEKYPITRLERAFPRNARSKFAISSGLALDLFHQEAFDFVAFLDIVVVFQADTALIAGSNFLNRILEALQ
jgi:hypothetical protein